MSSVSTARKIKLKMYIEGIEIPLISATIQEARMSTPSCTVNIGVNKYSQFLLPGSLMQLFYYMDGKDYLIFEGELATIFTERTTGSRSTSLQFIGLTNKLDHAWIHSANVDLEDPISRPFFVNVSNYGVSGNNTSKEDEDDNKSESLFTAAQTNQDPDPGKTYEDAKPGQATIVLNNQTKVNNILSVISTRLQTLSQEDNPLQSLIDSILLEAKNINPHFALQDKTLKISDRIYVFNNAKAIDLITNQNSFAFLSNSINMSPKVITIKGLLTTICNYLGYDWVELPAPCLVGGVPKSIIIKPSTTYLMPILCNVVYPNQALNYRYTRNFLSEPTRLSVNSPHLIFKLKEGVTALDGVFKAIVPATAVLKHNKELVLGFTKEEKYKGLYPLTLPAPPHLEWIYASVNNASDSERAEAEVEEVKAGSNSLFTEATITDENKVIEETPYQQDMMRSANRQFFETRSNARTAAFTTNYSPYRMVGFPGAILDSDGLYTVGNFVSINSSFSAAGSATQSFQVASPRLYLDDCLDFEVDTPPTFPEFYSSSYNAENIGALYQHLIQNKVASNFGGQASLYLYAINKINLEDKAENENKIAFQHRFSLNSALNLYNSSKNEHKYLYAKHHNYRELVDEASYWEFLGVGNKNNLFSDENKYRAADISVTQATDTEYEEHAGKPFVEERQSRVNVVKVRGIAQNGL